MSYSYFEPTRPIRSDKGIKARSQRGQFAKSWWATRWIKALEQLVDAGRLQRGRSYARKGQVLSIDETKDGIAAKVQGSRPSPYKIAITLKPLSDKEWDAVIKAMAERAIFTAQLLAGEMPQEIEEAFAAAGVSLFPDKRSDLTTSCSCPDYANPCKHVAATHYILGEQFDEDPFLIFRLRGRSQEQIMQALRASRSSEGGRTLAEERPPYITAQPAPPLTVEGFWSLAQPLSQFQLNLKPPLTPHPLLKRLGQPAFLDESIEALLGPAYDQASKAALEIANALTGELLTGDAQTEKIGESFE